MAGFDHIVKRSFYFFCDCSEFENEMSKRQPDVDKLTTPGKRKRERRLSSDSNHSGTSTITEPSPGKRTLPIGEHGGGVTFIVFFTVLMGWWEGK